MHCPLDAIPCGPTTLLGPGPAGVWLWLPWEPTRTRPLAGPLPVERTLRSQISRCAVFDYWNCVSVESKLRARV